MVKIRPVEGDEADSFLALLCRVFELDIGRARGVFFSEPLFDLRRKWALFEQGRIVSILTTVPLQFGWGTAIGIAGVATEPSEQGRGLGTMLIDYVLAASESHGERAALLFAKRKELYERCGFRELDRVVHATLEPSLPSSDDRLIGYDEVRRVYDAWAQEHPNRLRRDDKRWQYWKWNLRMCQAFGPGYLCIEGNVVREAVATPMDGGWPSAPAKSWVGLGSMTRLCGAPVVERQEDLYLMARGFEEPPQMFMTDQF